MSDFRYAVRGLLREPGFLVAAVITLALGIGANTAIFSVVNAVLLRPLPFANPDRLCFVFENNLGRGWPQTSVAPGTFLDWRVRSRTFERFAALDARSFALTGGAEPEQIGAAAVSADLFQVLGTNAALGRTFTAAEDAGGAERVVVLGHDLWRTRFGADPRIVGAPIQLSGTSYTVVGVMPAGFEFPSEDARLWVPLALTPEFSLENRGGHYLNVVARLKSGVDLKQAQGEMSSIAAAIEKDIDPSTRGWGVTLVPLREAALGGTEKALWILMATVAIVLLISCANVANLLLARSAARGRELAVRSALGATRSRVIRQLLAESVLLYVVGATAGLLLAVWGVDLLAAQAPAPISRATTHVIDARVLGFTLALALVTGLLSGLAPAIASTRVDLQASLKDRAAAGGGARGNRLRAFFVVAQVALSLLLLTGAGLLLRSFGAILDVTPGFDPRNVLTLRVSLPEPRYASSEAAIGFYDRALEEMRALPGVRYAAATHAPPLAGHSVRPFVVEGRPAPAAGEDLIAEYRIVTPDYFKAMGIRLVAGRTFAATDAGDAPGVVMVNEVFARRYFPGGRAVGRRITLGGMPDVWGEVIGVVEDIRHFGLEEASQPEMFWLSSQTYLSRSPTLQRLRRAMTFVVRTAQDPVPMTPSLRRAILAVDHDQPVSSVRTLEEILSGSVSDRRFQMEMMGLFAAIALILSTVGLYGVVSLASTQRAHEVGVRIALGARRLDIFRMILGGGLALACAGAVAGLALSWILTRLLGSLLFGVTATDAPAFGAATAILIGAALLACWLPARRATTVDPMVTLRYE